MKVAPFREEHKTLSLSCCLYAHNTSVLHLLTLLHTIQSLSILLSSRCLKNLTDPHSGATKRVSLQYFMTVLSWVLFALLSIVEHMSATLRRMPFFYVKDVGSCI